MQIFKDKNIDISNSVESMSMVDFCKGHNIYEVICIISKRAAQISKEFKEKLDQKLEEFAIEEDNLEEVFENKEQIEVARHYEQMPKPTLIALKEWIDGDIYYRNPNNPSDEG